MNQICLTIAIVTVLILPADAVADGAADCLLDGVRTLQCSGNPASMVVWGQAQPLVVSPDGRIFAASATLGAGRIVVIGQGSFTQTDTADSEVFTANAIVWLAGTRPKAAHVDEEQPRLIRVFGLSDAAATELEIRKIQHERVATLPGKGELSNVDVIVTSPQVFAKAKRQAELEQWVRDGGGLFVTETAWGTLQLNPDLTLDTLASNQLLEQVGIRFTGAANSGFGKDGDYPVDRALLTAANADNALKLLAGTDATQHSFASQIAANAFGAVPLDSPLIRGALNTAKAHREELDAVFESLAKSKLTAKKNALARAMFDLDSRMAMELPANEIKAHPSSTAFPGSLGKQRMATATIQLDPHVPGWHSTGLYAPPGEVVTVTVPDGAAAQGAVVQIGAWRDPHQHEYRVRMRDALRRFAIDKKVTLAASAIGGPIYIDLPEGFERHTDEKSLSVEITGAAAVPHFKLGMTDLDEWRSTIRHIDAPWAEMESDELILTVPSAAIRDLDRPDLAMMHWDKVHAAMQSLEPRTNNHWADRPYRYVADVSVSWGYMYCPSDGPIVIPTSAAAAMFQLPNFDAEGANELWGHYHEMGHAHQNQLWTDGATSEVTVNIFTVFALHTVNGYSLDSSEMRTDRREAWETFEAHRKSGNKFEEVGGPFERLRLYALLWHEFGFDAFRTTFKSIRELPKSERPENDRDERNTFMVHFSRTVGRNLSNYFAAWGIDITEAARQSVESLPVWMPTEPAAK